jgi:hypothetical protein
MSQFTKVLKKAFNTLSEATGDIQSPNNPTTQGAVANMDAALSRSTTNPNAKELENTLFGTSPDDATNPLHSAYDKIKQNPDNPKLSDAEQQAYNDQHEKMQSTSPTDDETTDGSGQNDGNTNSQQSSTNTSSTGSSDSSSGGSQSSHQPNGVQYNPLTAS